MKQPYLNDKQFLKDMDNETHKEHFIRISILDFQTEKVKASIEGKATSGSCNFSGTSNMRRTASCSLIVDPEGIKVNGQSQFQQYYNITEIENLISMNKKVRIETGLTNSLSALYPQYSQHNIIWYPLGVYVIKTASTSNGSNGVSISLTLNDKCALLNGDMGGTIPAATVFSEMETYSSDGLTRKVDKLLLKDIIKFLVVDLGGERPDNVIINDIDDYIVKVMKWNGTRPVCIDIDEQGNKTLTVVETMTYPENIYLKGKNIGYIIEPFVYPGTLECNAGETVSAMLDKIRNVLGNFEWFYDIEGRFIFQEIKNYVNSSLSKNILEIEEKDYLSIANLTKSIYTFDNNNKHLITSISNSPQYTNIKNDFIVWGSKKTASGVEKPIRYHLAFDTKPTVDDSKTRLALVYTDYRKLTSIIPLKNNYELGTPPAPNRITAEHKKLFYLSNSGEEAVLYAYNEELKCFAINKNYTICALTTDDWRAELYYLSLWDGNETFIRNTYAAELKAEWPKIWDPIAEKLGSQHINIDSQTVVKIPVYKGSYKSDIDKYDYEYWLDFLEGTQGGSTNISQFNINNIGCRTKVVNEKDINCLFTEDFPNYVYIEATGEKNVDEQRQVTNIMGKEAIQVSNDIFRQMSIGGNQNSAYDRIRELLYLHTGYSESINLSIIPIYHLEPNTRISIYDRETGVNGDYLIKTISLPLSNGTSSISATRCLERTI